MTTETTLEDLETKVIEGQKALADRNRLLVDLANSGHSSASLYHRLNAVRKDLGARPLSRDAIHVAIRRGRDNTDSK